MSLTLYCSATDVTHRVGQLGITLRTNDDPGALSDCLESAAAEVNFYLQNLYTPSALAGSEWVKRASRDIAVRFLCMRRLNSVPKSVQSQYEETIQKLDVIGSGKKNLPDAPARHANVPVLSNQRTHLWPHPRVVTERVTSTGTPSGYAPMDDPTGILDYVI